ncbi:MAG: hypothetical protein GY896_22880 [Gammaproteobacteria bacterium]|nr:hypothetical protein [Gammaproteobacteria bacterium]
MTPQKEIESLKRRFYETERTLKAIVKLYGAQGVMLDDTDLANVADDDNLIISRIPQSHKMRYRVKEAGR